jgi:hypothetical protein
MPQMIIANRLADGAVVFLAPGGESWTTAVASGAVIEEDAEAQRLLGAVKQLEALSPVIDPQVIQVKIDDGVVRPIEIRELIRAFGPTVRTDRGDTDWEPMPGLTRTGDRRQPGMARVSKNTKE